MLSPYPPVAGTLQYSALNPFLEKRCQEWRMHRGTGYLGSTYTGIGSKNKKGRDGGTAKKNKAWKGKAAKRQACQQGEPKGA